MIELLTALCLVLVIEGLLYALFPDALRRAMVQVLALPASTLRTAGLAAASLGVALLWLLRR